MRAKRRIQSHAFQPFGWGIFKRVANRTTKKPAGIKRKDAKNRGVVSGIMNFITTIAVPRKKKGATRMNGDFESSAVLSLSSIMLNCYKRLKN
jgi:hypothetical protein